MKNRLTQFVLIFVTYIVVDVAYQLSVGLKFMGGLYESAGIRDVISEQPNHAWTILFFFVMIAFVLLKLAVQPAIETGQYRAAIQNGALVGIAAYGTTGLVFLWTITGFPFLALGEFLVEGIVFCSVSSGLTAYLVLRKR